MVTNKFNEYEALEENVRHTFVSVVWTHKIQEKECDILSKKYKIFEIVRIALSSITSVGILSVLLYDQFWLKLASASVALILTFMTTYSNTFDSKNEIQRHKATALELLNIRNKLMNLLMEIRLHKKELNFFMTKYECLLDQLNVISQTAPNTSEKAVNKAKTALKDNKDNTYMEDEIDRFLPATLKRGTKYNG